MKKGGVIVYNPYSDKNDMLKQSVNDYGDLIYSSITSAAASFNDIEKKDIDRLMYMIFPFIIGNRSTKTQAGINFTKDVKVLSAGSFGVTVIYDKLVIK